MIGGAASPGHNVAALLARTAAAWPAIPALALGADTRLDYRGFAQRAMHLAAALRDGGLDPGDRVALVSHNAPAYIEALYACWWAGLVAVPVNAKLHPRELDYVLDNAGARAAFVDEAWASALGASRVRSLYRVVLLDGAEYRRMASQARVRDVAPVSLADPAWLFYTSGTTGRPKGVTLSHANLIAMAHCFLSDVAPVAPGDAILHPGPLSHGSGLYLLPHVARGATSVVPESAGFDPDEMLLLLSHWPSALFFAAPTMVKRLVGAPGIGAAELGGLKCIVYGGGPMYVEDAKAAFAALGPRLAQIYGQGESPMTITAMDRALVADAIARGDDRRLGSVGMVQTGMEVRIGSATSQGAPAGGIGEVLVRGPAVMQGYWRNAEASASALKDGWLHTGDLGVLDEDGFLTLKDRSKDLIISGGANIYPREIEEVLLQHPDVAEVAVVGRRHAEWGEEVVACVVARAAPASTHAREALVEALDAFCLAHIARFKRPREYRFLAELPKNNAGKVLKTALRDAIAAPDADSSA